MWIPARRRRAARRLRKGSLTEIYGQIAEELHGQYLLAYTPDVVGKEGGYHKIALRRTKTA
ncbi:MAG: hypothetical protein ABSC48_08715 [Terracidiphilus sp.]